MCLSFKIFEASFGRFFLKKTSLDGSPSGFYSPVLLRNRGQYCPREGGRRRNLNISSLYRHLILGRRPFFFFYLRGQQQQPVTSHKENNQLFKKIILSLFFTGEKTKTKTYFSASIPLFSQTRSERDGNYLNNFLALFFWVSTCHSKCSQREAIPPLLFPLPSPHDTRFHKKISGKFVFALQLLWNQYGAVQPHPSQFHFAPPPPPGGGKIIWIFRFFFKKNIWEISCCCLRTGRKGIRLDSID